MGRIATKKSERLLKMPEVMERCGFRSRQSIYDVMDRDSTFPRPVKIGKRGVRWVESEISAWIQRAMDRRDRVTGAK